MDKPRLTRPSLGPTNNFPFTTDTQFLLLFCECFSVIYILILYVTYIIKSVYHKQTARFSSYTGPFFPPQILKNKNKTFSKELR